MRALADLSRVNHLFCIPGAVVMLCCLLIRVVRVTSLVMSLAYGCVTAIRKIEEVAIAENLNCTIPDPRKLDTLPELFLPGMLIKISVPE